VVLKVLGAAGHGTEVPCFPLPHSSVGELKDVEVARFDDHERDLARGRIAVRDIRMMRVRDSPGPGPLRLGLTGEGG
jgi:hypothetical protein